MKIEDLKNKKILIAGYGVEGKTTEQFLKSIFPKIKIDIADKTQGPNYLDKQSLYDLAIKSPGIHKSLISIPYTTATNIFFANVTGTTIGVTGSKGKSTTSSLIYSILKKAGKKARLVGNITHKLDEIGSPMLSEMLKSNSEQDYWICELSSFMLDDIKYSPHISVITSFFPEHMDYHKSMQNYWEAKARIILQSGPNDFFVYNPEFKILSELAKQTKAKAIPFIQKLPFETLKIPLLGEHNMSNTRGAVTVAQILNISYQTIEKAIKSFIPLPHRLEKVGTYKGITFYDDAISTTPESTIEAIKAVGNVGTIFLGGQDRGFDFRQLAKIIVYSGIEALVLFPESGRKIFKEIQKISSESYDVLQTTNMKVAVEFAFKNTPRGSSCLLSTASPSYSVWKNFEEKGNLFKKLVREMGG